MQPSELLIVLCTVCLSALLAHRLKLAPPIAFLFGGLALAMIPGMDAPKIEPEYMLILFLPPILMEAAFFTSIRDFRRNLQPILLLALGLVVLTAGAVAVVVAKMIPGAGWALGFAVGAIVSPPDAAAATSALKNVPIPRRVQSILEGESLVNDATGIVLYKFAVGAVITASFSFADASIEFVWKAGAGILIGLACAYVFVQMFRFLRDPSVEILATFVPPYGAYMLAESVHASGVLAVVSCGLLIGWHGPSMFNARTRVPTEAVWRMVVFFLNALAFLLIGMQLPDLMGRLGIYSTEFLILSASAICLTTIAIRFLYVFGTAYMLPRIMPDYCRREPLPAWQNIFLVGWTGMRGVVTLALALALPVTLPGGEAFPHRDLIIFLSVSVILVTLVLQGLSLPWLTDRLTLTYDPKRTQEEWLARVNTTRQALRVLDTLETQDGVHMPALERIRAHYMERLESLGDGPNTPLNPNETPNLMSHPLQVAENRIWQDALNSEREALFEMRRSFAIGDDVMYDILRETDLLANRFYAEPIEVPATTVNAEVKRRTWQRIYQRKAAA